MQHIALQGLQCRWVRLKLQASPRGRHEAEVAGRRQQKSARTAGWLRQTACIHLGAPSRRQLLADKHAGSRKFVGKAAETLAQHNTLVKDLSPAAGCRVHMHAGRNPVFAPAT